MSNLKTNIYQKFNCTRTQIIQLFYTGSNKTYPHNNQSENNYAKLSILLTKIKSKMFTIISQKI